jgi:cytidine deaminase
LVTLARGARSRIGAADGAAVLDEMGRSYTGCTVTLPTLSLSAVHLAVANAVASGSRGLDVVVIVSAHDSLDPLDLDTIRDFAGPGVPITVVDDRGSVVHEAHT